MESSDLPSISDGQQQTSFIQTNASNDLIDGACISIQVSDSSLEPDTDVSATASSAESDHVHGGDVPAAEQRVLVKPAVSLMEGEGIYKMSAEQRGICLIINNINFLDKDQDRLGSEKDGKSLQQLFTQMGFAVHSFLNLTANEMIQTFEDYSKREEHRFADCFVAIILTHGQAQNRLYGTDSIMVPLDEDLISQFNNANCPLLMRKPKLFFVQACRGDIRDMGVCVQNVADAAGFAATAEKQVLEVKLPSWSDTLICHSTIDGYVSIRNIKTGSWFVDALCRELCEHAWNTDLNKLLMRVNNKLMSREGESAMKQSLEVVYRGWCRDLYFNPGVFDV